MAKKSKGFSELLLQEKYTDLEKKQFGKLKEKMKTNPLGTNVQTFITNSQDLTKMSEILEAFAGPYLDSVNTESDYHKLLQLLILAWNLSLLPQEEYQQQIQAAIQATLDPKDREWNQDFKQLLEEMIARKHKFFADHQRFIIDYEIKLVGKNLHLSVASTLPDELNPDDFNS